jgi:heterodisulfide reductase subunit A
MKRIGVFVCHCGRNISNTVDVDEVVREMKHHPGVVHCEDYKYMCSDPGQKLIKDRITEKKLDGVVVAACTPLLHEVTFRRAADESGLNSYMLEMANIREQCSWIHTDRDKATEKAKRIIEAVVEKTKRDQALVPAKIPVTPRALVIGGGIAGIQAALDIANAGHEVLLVERTPSIGGHMAQLSETFPTLDCSQCILTPRMVDVAQHTRVRLLTYAEIEGVNGHVGNFKVKIRVKSSCVDSRKCTGCGLCYEKCPIAVSSEFDEGLGKRKAIYVPFPQAVPNRPVIDKEHCTFFLKPGKCRVCQIVCPAEAVDFEQADEIIEEEVGAIIVATGYGLYPVDRIPEYGGGKYHDVINGLQFERILSASGPTHGEIIRPSDSKIPKRIAFICCVGSRDPEHHLPYCSKFCCMYNAKHALLYKERVPDGEAIVFSIDVRTAGKDYEEFMMRAKDEEKVLYLRGKPSRIIKEGDELVVWTIDTLTGRGLKVRCDMVVLSMAVVPAIGATELARKLRIQTNVYGFFTEAHPKLRPVESLAPGFFLAGCAQAPKDIPETVAQASAAASKVLEMFAKKELATEPMIVAIDEDRCCGCRLCVVTCPYEAREIDTEKNIVRINEALCMGCGCCVAACPSGASEQKNLFDEQMSKMVEVILRE